MSFRVLVVDNDDSFVHTLCDYLAQLGAQVHVRRSREISTDAAASVLTDADAVLVSPGPGRPADAGGSISVIRAAAESHAPLLGVCLGHQALAETFGGRVSVAPELMHGKTSRVTHAGEGLFAGLPDVVTVGRYHSLAVEPDSVPDVLRITARTESGTVMGLAHRSLPLWGVQFHPESVLTEGGHRLLANWLAAAGMPGAVEASHGLHPLVPAP